MGPPFTTRQIGNKGLSFPEVLEWPNFVCEGCTVRAVLDRKLHSRTDQILLILERMRMIDMAHYWAPSTHRHYQGKLRFLRTFQSRFPGLTLLANNKLEWPPRGHDIGVMWAEEAYSLRSGTSDVHVAFGTIRALRSALSHYEAVKAIQSGIPTHLDQQNRLIYGSCRVTDQAPHTLFMSGLAARIGTETKPAVALLMRHIQAFDQLCLREFRASTTPDGRRCWSLAGLLNCVLWLGWLRSRETFNLKWSDTILVNPKDGPSVDLPNNVGVCLFDLGPSTKTSRSQNAKVVVAYECMSGLSCGHWLKRAFQSCDGINMKTDHRYIFCHASGIQWTSRYFRHEFLYPLLQHLRQEGDMFLRAFNDEPGNTIPEKFWSLHCYRRGARTHVTKWSKTDSRRATPDQIYEHGRWRKRRSSEATDKQYDEWTIQDRIQNTLFCH